MQYLNTHKNNYNYTRNAVPIIIIIMHVFYYQKVIFRNASIYIIQFQKSIKIQLISTEQCCIIIIDCLTYIILSL